MRVMRVIRDIIKMRTIRTMRVIIRMRTIRTMSLRALSMAKSAAITLRSSSLFDTAGYRT